MVLTISRRVVQRYEVDTLDLDYRAASASGGGGQGVSEGWVGVWASPARLSFVLAKLSPPKRENSQVWGNSGVMNEKEKFKREGSLLVNLWYGGRADIDLVVCEETASTIIEMENLENYIAISSIDVPIKIL